MLSSYLERVRDRRSYLELKRQMVLGIVGGWLLGAFAIFRYLYVAQARTATAMVLLTVALILFLLGFLRPRALRHVERVVRGVTGRIGKGLLGGMLTLAYLAVITPVGLILRRWRGSAPFYTWQGPAPSHMEGWNPKPVMDDLRVASSSAEQRTLLAQPFVVLGYFIRYGHFILIPILLFLLVLGLLMFFVKSSALAPFIYTLF